MVEFKFEEYQWVTCKYDESWHGIVLKRHDPVYYRILVVFENGQPLKRRKHVLHRVDCVKKFKKPLMAYINPEWL